MNPRFNLIRIISKIHLFLYRVSRGKVGGRFFGIEILLLTTIGYKSGRKRRVPLAAIPYYGNYLVVASFGGSPKHPAWFINITHNPNVEIRIGSITKKATTAIIESVDSRYNMMWAMAVKVTDSFDSYRKSTTRNIPIVLINI